MNSEEQQKDIAIWFKVIPVDDFSVIMTTIGILEGTLEDAVFYNNIGDCFFHFDSADLAGEYCYGFPISLADLKKRLNISDEQEAKRTYCDMLLGINFIQYTNYFNENDDKNFTYSLVFNEVKKGYETIKIEDSMKTLFDLPKELLDLADNEEDEYIENEILENDDIIEDSMIDHVLIENMIQLNDIICNIIKNKNEKQNSEKTLKNIDLFLNEYLNKENDLYSKMSLEELKQVALEINKMNIPIETAIIPQNKYQRILEILRERIALEISSSSLKEQEIKKYSTCFEASFQTEIITPQIFLYQNYTKIDILKRLYTYYCNSGYSEEQLKLIRTIFQQSHPRLLYSLEEHHSQNWPFDYIQKRNEMIYHKSKLVLNRIRMIPSDNNSKIYFKTLISFLPELEIKNLGLYLQELRKKQSKRGDETMIELLSAPREPNFDETKETNPVKLKK